MSMIFRSLIAWCLIVLSWPTLASAELRSSISTQVVSAAQVLALSDAWAQRLVKDANHRVELAYPLSDQTLPSGKVQLALGAGVSINANYASVPVEIRVNGVLIRSMYAAYRILTLVSTPVLVHAKERGEVLTASDFIWQRVPDDGRGEIELSRLVGRTLNADHTVGSIVRPEETSITDIVKAGAPVVLIVHDGQVALAADVVARTSGGLGETVSVYDENAQRTLSGIVTAPSRVELTLPEVSNQ